MIIDKITLISRRGMKSKGMTLIGDQLTGDTYRMSKWIKSQLEGKWNPVTKAWTINPEKLSSPDSAFAIKK